MERGPEVLGGHPLQQCLHCNVHGKTKLTTTPNLCKKKQDGDARSLAGESHAMPSQTRCACTGLVESFVYGNCDFTVLLNMYITLYVHVTRTCTSACQSPNILHRVSRFLFVHYSPLPVVRHVIWVSCSMAKIGRNSLTTTVRVSLVGHSFIRRLRDAIRHKADLAFLDDFGLQNVRLDFVCKGGWKIRDIQDNLPSIITQSPNIVLLIMYFIHLFRVPSVHK